MEKNWPFLIMLVGLPASGKTALAKQLAIEDGEIIATDEAFYPRPVIHSSDALRLELYGSEEDNRHNNQLFTELHRRIKRDLLDGKHVIYDATNIKKKQRMAFLNEIAGIVCEKVCICVMTTFEDCLARNSERERKIPERAIERMYKNWQPPHYHEGFNQIYFYFSSYDYYTAPEFKLSVLFDEMKDFNQGNRHHALTLGQHCLKAQKYITEKAPTHKTLLAAAFLHDIGKLVTKSYVNAKGEEDGDCHYYQHQCVGAYMAVFYLAPLDYSIEEKVDIINMIYFHMHPFMGWKQSEKALERDRRMIGDELYRDIILLHEADVAAH